MKPSKEDIRQIAIFEFNGQIIPGNINRNIIDLIDANIKSYFDKKILRILTIELLQQFSRLSSCKDFFNDFSYILGQDSNKYFIFFSKTVSNKKLEFVNDISIINKCNFQELKVLFKEIMHSSTLSGRPSSESLFLIELKRKSREDIIFKHQYYDEENSTIEFVISVEVGLILKRKLTRFFQQNHELAETTLTWHKERNLEFEDDLAEAIEKLSNIGFA